MKKTFFTFIITLISLNYLAQALSADTLHWTDHRNLSWTDFKGDTIALPNLSGQSLLVVLANFKKAHYLLPTITNVVAVFDKKNSWANNSSKTDQLLKYYQVTFDLYENYARKLRKEFSKTKFGLDPNKIFQEKYNAMLNALSDRNKQLMKETKMGQDSEALQHWDDMMKTELAELEAYRHTQ